MSAKLLPPKPAKINEVAEPSNLQPRRSARLQRTCSNSSFMSPALRRTPKTMPSTPNRRRSRLQADVSLDTPSSHSNGKHKGVLRSVSSSSISSNETRKGKLKGYWSTIEERKEFVDSGRWLSQYDHEPRLQHKLQECIDWENKQFRKGYFQSLNNFAKLALYRCCLDVEFQQPLVVAQDPLKGRCVVADVDIGELEYVLEYRGELMKHLDAKSREARYDEEDVQGSFMYYFTVDGQKLCLDSTSEDPLWGLGRLVNHSKVEFNLKPKSMRDSVGAIRLFFYSTRDIKKGEELLFDYGERDPEVIEKFPWLET